MVLNEDKAREAEAIIKELSLFSFSKEDLVRGKIEDISRFEVLMSRYASLKNNSELKDLVSQLEDKYQIPKTVSANVETYNQLRKELLSSKQLEEFNDREQMLLRTNETVDISQLSTEEQIAFLTKQWQAVEKAATYYNQAKKESQKADKELADNYHKKPSDRRGIVFAVRCTRGAEDTQKFIKMLSPECQAQAWEQLKEVEKLIQQNGGVPPRLIREETGRLLFPLDKRYRQNKGEKDVVVSVSDEGYKSVLVSNNFHANYKMAGVALNNAVGGFTWDYGKVNAEAQGKIDLLNMSPEAVVAVNDFPLSRSGQGDITKNVGTFLHQFPELNKATASNAAKCLKQASDGKGDRAFGVSALLDGLQESLPDQNKGVSTVEKTFKLR